VAIALRTGGTLGGTNATGGPITVDISGVSGLANGDLIVAIGSPADFGRLIADKTEKWGNVIRAANIKPD
jgi:hypothetical protein